MRAIRNLTFAAYGMHLADQIALVAVPLVVALVFGAPAQVIGLLVACQSMAHLLGSLPFGLIIDRAQARTVAIVSTLISLAGFGGAALSILGGSLVGFGAFVVVGGFGIVVFVLVSLSILPRLAQPSELARANARLDLARALCSFAVPLAIGLLITTRTANWVFVVAAAGGLLALVSAIGLPRFPVSPPRADGIVSLIREGGRFVLRHQLLLPIAICAVLWNLAFAALLAIMVPLAVDIYLAEPGVFGIALSAFGLAATLGAFTVGRLSAVLPTSFFLLFGPGSSVVAILLLFAVAPGGSVLPVYAAFFILGFGPSMWLTTQNSVRQLVTPAAMLGRVNAVIQTAIYGIRPVGALLGGFIAGTASPDAALVFVAAAYAGSFAVPLFSRLRTVRRFTDLTIMEAG
ncbi:MAG: MFS transporter [Neoaquamicrobium sediminum]|uniref:MFS transporter n=1 Tax=Neoaquamicrobium sediminum TaxID=1849104 RepID=UPI004034FC81